ncbi:MAG: DUF456 domain-containing protein [Phycisphaerales bacterium]|nr:DUF456 domain-containing protein [Phycisphaerales bacterium]
MELALSIAIGVSFVVYCLAMVGATVIGLPGMWMMLVAALGLKLYDPSLFSWWLLGAAGALTLAGEIAELGSSAAGAKVGGASKKAMGAAVIGGIVGAIVGTFAIPIPVVGTIVGSAVGSGLAASAVELRAKDFEGKELRKRAAKVGAGAAAGRLVAVIVKGAMALALALLLGVAVFV